MQQLASIERGAFTTLDVAVAQVDRALDALEHQDIELATFIINDGPRLEIAHEAVLNEIMSLLALQAPVAGDLRLVVALLHVIKHVERIGAQCVNVAKLIPLTGSEPPRLPEVLDVIMRMGRLARDEVVQARHALTLRDGDLAADLRRRDQELNELNRAVFRQTVELGREPDTREWLLTMAMVARAFERVGDNAVDIGAQVVFVVDGVTPTVTDVDLGRSPDAESESDDAPGTFGNDA
ncbi:MAG: PhoU family transcriptional regulator [Patulibacter sp.]|nr:PhoU family transcriptional regulator [Patulibacter sp.]